MVVYHQVDTLVDRTFIYEKTNPLSFTSLDMYLVNVNSGETPDLSLPFTHLVHPGLLGQLPVPTEALLQPHTLPPTRGH